MRASDGNLYVTKFSNNPLGIRVLASEFLATKIGLFLGLPMPEVGMIEVPKLLIKDTKEMWMETEDGEIIRCASGRHLAVRYVGDIWKDRVFDFMPKAIFSRVTNRTDFLKILPFDKWLGNCDHRQAVFVGRAGKRKYKAIFIDQHDCFDGSKWQFPDDPIMGIHGKQHVYKGVIGWNSFEPTLGEIEKFDVGDLRRIASEVPAEWYERNQTEMSRLVKKLYQRRKIVRRLISEFRDCSRQPFPNWQDN